jgi:hypothetical protein
MEVILYLNDNLLKVKGLQNAVSLSYLNGLTTVKATLIDDDGFDVLGETWPATLAYVSGSDGDYMMTLDTDLELVVDAKYHAVIDVDGGPGLKAHWKTRVIVRERTSAEAGEP